MGPLPFSSGNQGLLKSEHKLEEASMGPLPFSSGNLGEWTG